MLKRKGLPERLEIEFEGGLSPKATPYAGIGLLVDLGRLSGVMGVAKRCLPDKKSPKGLDQGQFVESFVVLSALGGDCIDDFAGLRLDEGLKGMLGYQLPAAATARQWLDTFHDESLLADRPLQGSFIPVESPRLAALTTVMQRIPHAYVAAVKKMDNIVTLDVDAHVVESSKRTALWTYEGSRGYQPLLVQWAETHLILADQFRDGNVPASENIKELVARAYDSLPQREGGWRVQVRSDSAGYQWAELDDWDGRGWRFAVSADMSPSLRKEIENLPADQWYFWSEERGGVVREWAEVPFVPSRPSEHRGSKPYRYLAIRIRRAQGELFADGNSAKHFAVVTNDWNTGGQEMLEWHRGKAGTVEHAHLVLKDELGAGVYPSAKFGANAAWLRLQVLTFNLLELHKEVSLDKKYRNARPKRLRFAIFTHIGVLVSHARRESMRLMADVFESVIRLGRHRHRQLCPAWNAI